jgi:hypothetical protein
LHDPVNFAFDSAVNPKFPITIQPGAYRRFYFCFAPKSPHKDSTIVEWITDESGQYRDSIKSWSYLKAAGVKPGVIWDRPGMTIFADSNDAKPFGIGRINLLNKNTANTYIFSVVFEGQDADQFRIVGNSLNYNPLTDSVHGYNQPAGDSVWIDIEFDPDISKPYPIKYADRHTNFVAYYYTDAAHTVADSTIASITGTFDIKYKNGVSEPAPEASPLAAFIQDRRLIIHFPNGYESSSHIELYDLLGRRIAAWGSGVQADAEGYAALPLPQLASGMYILRLGDNTVKVIK